MVTKNDILVGGIRVYFLFTPQSAASLVVFLHLRQAFLEYVAAKVSAGKWRWRMDTERSLPEVPTLPLLATGSQRNCKETGNAGTNPYLVKHKMALPILFRAAKCPTKTHVPQFPLHGAVAQFWFMRPNWKPAVILGRSLASLIQAPPLPPPSSFSSVLPGMQI